MVLSFLRKMYGVNTSKKLQVLVVGYYDRYNIGDEAYKTAIPKMFNDKNISFTFQCTDDITEIPSNTDIVLCGGGDIINTYFMTKIHELLKSFKGPVYALSVGIPFHDDTKYLDIFDHVFVRSQQDYNIVSKAVGIDNVTVMPDVTLTLSNRKTCFSYEDDTTIKLGVCLANPMFSDNVHKDALITSICNILTRVLDSKIKVYLLAFNYDVSNMDENDIVVNKVVYETLKANNPNYDVFLCEGVDYQSPSDMLNFIAKLDITLCMRFHSVVFSFICKTRPVVLNVSPKVNKFVTDNSYEKYTVNLPIDENDNPVSIDETAVFDTLFARLGDPTDVSLAPFNFTGIKKTVVKKSLRKLLVKNDYTTKENTYLNVKRILTNYLNIDNSEYDKLLTNTGKFVVSNYNNLNIARIIAFAITGHITSSYIWGLSDNMMKNTFNLYEAIKHIYEDFYKNKALDSMEEQYYPVMDCKRSVFVDLDFVFQNDFRDFHRFGWSYVVGGLTNLDGASFLRDGQILVDTYVDRSFFWGLETLKTIGILPYKKPWIGFIHHTFDRSCSNNCYELFKNSVFIESLKTCKGLITLSKYLGRQLKANLVSRGFLHVDVYILYHPMETVDNKFTFDKFLDNPQKKVVQIGAWLRNPYAIYELPLTESYKNPLKIQKAALKGKDMDSYFKPADLLTDLKTVLVDGGLPSPDGPCRDCPMSRDICRDCPVCRDMPICRTTPVSRCPICRCTPVCRNTPVSRDPISRDCPVSRDPEIFENKYSKGLYDMLVENDESVEIIDRLSNEDFDVLLSENIVFLNLVDASAVNTVLECIVRNTILLCNRHPALEEALGVNYPGFYTNLVDATLMLGNQKKLKEIHNYLKRLDKKQFTLSYFLEKFQEIVKNI